MPPRNQAQDTAADDAAVTDDAPLSYTQDELTAIIRQALAAQKSDTDAQMRALTDQIAGLQASISGTVPALIREHGAGPGTDTAETWSQWEQERAWLAREAASA